MRVSCRSLKGFTLPEVLVAGAMSAAFMTAAALSFQAVTYNQQRYQGLVSVTVNSGGGLAGAVGNFYPNLTGQTILNVYGSPAYGRAAAAQNV
ncbi:MAG: prepilin-type N-terminal cleavage/methylation domain-containing protein, partial [Verrucomicrobiaceae bacterium]|nr:prepilin-type N-terminal cleavage/methylation domain-containing protein [Verrucomicrobiaceae bacterium]